MKTLIASIAAITLAASFSVKAQEDDGFGRPDINSGRSVFNMTCASCHSLNRGENGTGPSLAGVYGRRAGSVADFAYSEPIRKSGLTWTEDTLDTYLRNPSNLGTQVNMIIHGIVDKKMRADLISFLKHNAK